MEPGQPEVAAPDQMAATRASYDAVASGYAEAMSDELRHKPLDRAVLARGDDPPEPPAHGGALRPPVPP